MTTSNKRAVLEIEADEKPDTLVQEARNRNIDLRDPLDAGIHYKFAEHERTRLRPLYALKIRRDKSGLFTAVAVTLFLPWIMSRGGGGLLG